jgi:hypothetical protein
MMTSVFLSFSVTPSGPNYLAAIFFLKKTPRNYQQALRAAHPLPLSPLRRSHCAALSHPCRSLPSMPLLPAPSPNGWRRTPVELRCCSSRILSQSDRILSLSQIQTRGRARAWHGKSMSLSPPLPATRSLASSSPRQQLDSMAVAASTSLWDFVRPWRR